MKQFFFTILYYCRLQIFTHLPYRQQALVYLMLSTFRLIDKSKLVDRTIQMPVITGIVIVTIYGTNIFANWCQTQTIRLKRKDFGWTLICQIESLIFIVVIANVLNSLIVFAVKINTITKFLAFEWHSVVLMMNYLPVCSFLFRSTFYRINGVGSKILVHGIVISEW